MLQAYDDNDETDEPQRSAGGHCHCLLSGVIPAPHLTSSQASTWVKTPQVGHVPLTI